MMHLRARRLVPLLLDDAVEPGLARRLRAHVAGCARCASELGALRRADALLRRMPFGLAIDALDLRREHRVRRLSRWARRAAPTARPALTPGLGRALAAATPLVAAACVALAVLAGRPGHEVELDPPEAFNFVLAASFSTRPAEPAEGLAPRAVVTASTRPDESGRESYLLPIGVR